MPIVVGFIPTREGRAALRRAAVECGLRGSDLVVVDTSGGAKYDAEDRARFESALEGIRSDLDARGVAVTRHERAESKEAADDLLGEAEESGAELIVIGLRRRTPVGKLILGSNAQRILLEATCPVLAVKAGPESADGD